MWWDDPRAYSDYSPIIFLMYYLDDTSRENGCLRLLPGTHRRWHQLHEMGTAHTKDINRMEDEHDPRFADYPGEVDVPVGAEDPGGRRRPAVPRHPRPTPPATTGR